MAGVTNSDHTHTILLSLLDSHLHSLVTDNLTHTVVTVDNCGGLGLFDDLKVGNGVLDTCLDSVKVDRLEAVAAVRLDAALVALKQNVSTDLSILARNAVAYKGVDDEIGDCFPVKDNSFVVCHCF